MDDAGGFGGLVSGGRGGSAWDAMMWLSGGGGYCGPMEEAEGFKGAVVGEEHARGSFPRGTLSSQPLPRWLRLAFEPRGGAPAQQQWSRHALGGLWTCYICGEFSAARRACFEPDLHVQWSCTAAASPAGRPNASHPHVPTPVLIRQILQHEVCRAPPCRPLPPIKAPSGAPLPPAPHCLSHSLVFFRRASVKHIRCRKKAARSAFGVILPPLFPPLHFSFTPLEKRALHLAAQPTLSASRWP